MKSRILAAVTALLMACGANEEPAPPVYGTLTGALNSQNGTGHGSAIRLALAWFPSYGPGYAMSQPKAIVTEDVVYQGSFPLNYAFNVTSKPPASAIGDWSAGGGPNGAAVGILLAYEDRNGNAKLDSIPANGSPIDKVLGASMDLFVGTGFGLVYFDGTLPANADALAKSLIKGFNLVKDDHVVPMSTQIPIHLSGGSELDLYVCEEFWDPNNGGASVPCGISLLAPAQMFGMLEVFPTHGSAFVTVNDKAGMPVAATVMLDGLLIPEGDEPGLYVLEDPTGSLILPGATYTVTAHIPGAPVHAISVTMPGAFAITTPSDGATLTSGESATVTWSESSGATAYYGTVLTLAGDPIDLASQTGTTWNTQPLEHVGTATINVSAISGGPFATFVGAVNQTVTVDLAE